MSVVTLAVALSVSGVIGLIAWKGHESVRTLQRNLAIEAFFDPSMTSDEASTLVNSQISKIDGIASVSVVTKEQALEDYKKSSDENIEAVLGVNPLPASVRIYLHDPSSASALRVQSALRSIAGVTDVRSDESLLRTTESRAQALDAIAIIISGLLLLSAILFVANSARLLLGIRGKALHTLALMGASRWQMAGPFVIEGGLSGFVGGFVSCLIIAGIVHLGFSQLSIEFSKEGLFILSIILIALGFIIGVLASVATSLPRLRHF